MNKVFFIALISILVVSSFVVAGSVLATATIDSVKLNGLNNLTAEGGARITVAVNVTLANKSVWKSTAYRLGNGVWNCVDTPDHSGNITVVETFLINAPAEQGTSGVDFKIYGNDDCTNGLDVSMASASLATAAALMNILSLGTGEIWLAVVASVLIIIILIFSICLIMILAISLIVKRIIKKN